MSRDTDGQHRLWLSLGYAGKNGNPATWRYWEKQPKGSKHWIISAPNNYAVFEQHDKKVFFNGKEIHTGKTQWAATWEALAYFYKEIIPNVSEPALSPKK